MDHGDASWKNKLRIRLYAMERAYGDLTAKCTPIEFASDWYVFLTAFNGFFEILKRAAKRDERLNDLVWGAIIPEADSNPLLKYVFEARNDEEHGLSESVVYQTSMIGAYYQGGHGDGQINVTIRKNEDGSFEMLDFKSTFPEGVAEPFHEKRMLLEKVTSRRGDTYDPPTTHEGAPLEGRQPEDVARLALAYMRSLMAEMERF